MLARARALPRKYALLPFAAVLLTLAARDVFLQMRDTAYVGARARAVVAAAGAVTPRERVVALRDYLRRTVTYLDAPYERRPFLRDSAAETLRGGKGYCGEVTRTFICMANAVGVTARRINLYGDLNHVVAEADLGPDESVIVDCQQPPQIPDLVPLEQVLRVPAYHGYSTLNLRRLGLGVMVTHVQFGLGFLTYWAERPYALRAFLWTLPLILWAALNGLRALVRWALAKRGWVHCSNRRALEAALARQGPAAPAG